ncbi:hypothetical protein HXX76_011426 [Chlamydomonas incerta]|uniref:Uncharacterized protein n=1 Tax=Chlamydomonas incerta TaxID=51695 RepID=A0A835SK92_CHLIN|nr:hypothetical protein HXX76_011426 [Chlamydomonas incerta]|eukprot:KAG2428722.1 hypothetical protein HXX76_011426 [Chlamydomonas incerta]
MECLSRDRGLSFTTALVKTHVNSDTQDTLVEVLDPSRLACDKCLLAVRGDAELPMPSDETRQLRERRLASKNNVTARGRLQQAAAHGAESLQIQIHCRHGRDLWVSPGVEEAFKLDDSLRRDAVSLAERVEVAVRKVQRAKEQQVQNQQQPGAVQAQAQQAPAAAGTTGAAAGAIIAAQLAGAPAAAQVQAQRTGSAALAGSAMQNLAATAPATSAAAAAAAAGRITAMVQAAAQAAAQAAMQAAVQAAQAAEMGLLAPGDVGSLSGGVGLDSAAAAAATAAAAAAAWAAGQGSQGGFGVSGLPDAAAVAAADAVPAPDGNATAALTSLADALVSAAAQISPFPLRALPPLPAVAGLPAVGAGAGGPQDTAAAAAALVAVH